MFLTLLNFYILLSLYPLHLFMEFRWFVAVHFSGFKFFFFFFPLQISTFSSSSSSFVVKAMAKKNHEIFVIRFSFSLLFCMQFLLDFWFLGILLFGFNPGFVLVDIWFFFSHLHFTLVWILFFFSLFLVMQF